MCSISGCILTDYNSFFQSSMFLKIIRNLITGCRQVIQTLKLVSTCKKIFISLTTGACIPETTENTPRSFCEISAWCPVETDETLSQNSPVLKGTEKFTVYIKNSIAFPHFGSKYRRNNIISGTRPSIYHQTKNPLGQIFNIGEIVELAGGNYTSLAIKGGVIGVR